MAYKLSPSDFAFLWDECLRCFYLKYRLNFDRPRGPFPAIFGKIDAAMRARFDGELLGNVVEGAPRGKVDASDRWVESTEFGGVFVRGKTDGVVTLDAGGFAVVDFKTSAVKPEYLAKYGRQLEAYAYALETGSGSPKGEVQVKELGLIVFEPQEISQASGRKTGVALYGPMTWVPIERNRAEFERFLKQVWRVLELKAPPEAAEKCSWCAYRERARAEGL